MFKVEPKTFPPLAEKKTICTIASNTYRHANTERNQSILLLWVNIKTNWSKNKTRGMCHPRGRFKLKYTTVEDAIILNQLNTLCIISTSFVVLFAWGYIKKYLTRQFWWRYIRAIHIRECEYFFLVRSSVRSLFYTRLFTWEQVKSGVTWFIQAVDMTCFGHVTSMQILNKIHFDVCCESTLSCFILNYFFMQSTSSIEISGSIFRH